MARDRKGGAGRQGPVKGFRPGREPAQLRKQAIKQQLGETNWAQDKLIDAFAGRSPDDVRRMVGRWTTGSLAVAVLLGVLAVGLAVTGHPIWALLVGAFTAAAFFLWWRLQKQRANLDALAQMMTGGRPRRPR